MPAKINLPAFLEERLHDATHEPAVRKALQEFGKWFDESKQTFFPDYTNHGIQHIEQVLDTVANLIPQTAEISFSKDDAAALILAVLLHDSALHLSKAGFWNLIKGPDQYAHLPFFDRAGWGQTWADFMFLARRWDDAMLANVFGKDETGAPRAQVRDPFEHWQNLTETDNLLIGEFIRKHHPRLAHEMALYGVPGTTGAYLTLNDLPTQWRDLVGLVARSHGLPLRTGLDYLKKTPHFGTFAHRDYRNVHAVYLMALLRVGDYIQIQGDRTSERVFEYKDIRSLVSQVEHKAHLSDIIITDKTDDPESLQIDAHPEEVAVFLRLKEWLAGIQQELDSSWAVLGEVYGLQPKLKNLGLTFRRVRSNLDDVADFAKTVPYVPDRIRFDVARAELLKLLIGPLYGDNPSYGVRELMQNSIDAVREYEQFVLDNPQYKNLPRREQEADIVIELDQLNKTTGLATMTISDRGIGMQEATIRDYFLRAGASYRQNATWKSAFENNGVEGVKSKVLRSGRFGVGALAAFLIGKKIEVETRHVAADEGYSFTTSLEAESIHVKKEILPVGTCIRIPVSVDTYQALIKEHAKTTLPNKFDWYRFNKPTVVRKWCQTNGLIVQGQSHLLNLTDPKQGWHKLETSFPYEIYWTLKAGPALTCNGLFISSSDILRQVPKAVSKRPTLHDNPLEYPLLAIIDPDGAFPLNLQRNNLRTDDYEFGAELMRDVLQEMLAWLLFNGPHGLDSPSIPEITLPWLAFLTRYYTKSSALVICKHGYGVRLSILLDGMAVRHTINYQKGGFELSILTDDTFIFTTDKPWDKTYSRDHFVDLSVTEGLNSGQKVKALSRTIGYYNIYNNKKAPKAKFPKDNNNPEKNSLLEQQKKGWLITCEPDCPIKEFDIQNWPEIPKSASVYEQNGKRVFFSEHFFPDNSFFQLNSKPWLLDELWQEHFGKNWIPFALEDRIAKFPKAAQSFKERYPQVVPDEAWALLGGKPAAEK